jgi:hypothetical protein
MWHETTFIDGISNHTKVEFSNRSGNKDQTSGDEEYILRLEGYDITWNAYKQARQGSTATPAGDELLSDQTCRIILSNRYLQYNGMMVRVKFRALDSEQLKIQSAYIVQQSGETGDDPYDGSTQMQYTHITFDGGQDSVTIPANTTEWSDWIQMRDTAGPSNPLPLDKANSYLITFYVPDSTNVVYWEDPNISDDPMSYLRSGAVSGEVNWPAELSGERRIYAAEEVEVTYMNNGNFTSQIFDTGIENPAFTTMQYNAIANTDASLTLKVRSDDNKANLEADGDWISISGITLAGSPADISAISGGRYVQFRAEFTSIAGGTTTDDYDQSCILKDVSIYWPGNTTMVDIGGYFTKKSDYGTFTVEVDGQKLTKGFEINLTIDEDISTGATVNRSIATEVEPRNTSK